MLGAGFHGGREAVPHVFPDRRVALHPLLARLVEALCHPHGSGSLAVETARGRVSSSSLHHFGLTPKIW
jgi:hypothetical protein